MFNTNKLQFLRPLSEKHIPFQDAVRGQKFTYKNVRGQLMSLTKRKYTWSDPTKLDAEGKPTGPILEAVLKAENAGTYNFEEYETNEYERIAIADDLPIAQTFELFPKATEAMNKSINESKERMEKLSKKQMEIDSKLNNVVVNYTTLFANYESVRMEISNMAAELPALQNSPFKKDYFTALMPVVENMAKVNFPDMVKDPVVTPPATPAVEAVGKPV